MSRLSHRARALLACALLVGVAACSSGDGTGSPGLGDGTSTTDGGGDGTVGDGEVGTDPGAPVPSPGCASAAPAAQEEKERHTLDVDGEERWYLLTAPESGDPVPLVLDFHGLGEGAEIHTLMSAMGELGLEEGFATAFPQGTGEPVRWSAAFGGAQGPDLAFVDALVDSLGEERCIDTARVYATGLSNGAMMTSLLACERADRIAAFALVAGVVLPADCDPGRPVPILAFHGTDDEILYFNGGVGDLSIVTGAEPPASTEARPPADLDGPGFPATVAGWADLQGCDPAPADEQVTAEVTWRSYTCPTGAAVEFVIVHGGGHTWPGSAFSQGIAAVVGFTTDDVDASEEAWAFFQRHPLPTG